MAATYNSLSRLTNVAIEAAIKAGSLLEKGLGTAFEILRKPGAHNYVTEFDHAAEKSIIASIRTHFPSHAFLCEESGSIPADSDILWIIDPLDGTTNFAHNIPLFSVSIGVLGPEGLMSGVALSAHHPGIICR